MTSVVQLHVTCIQPQNIQLQKKIVIIIISVYASESYFLHDYPLLGEALVILRKSLPLGKSTEALGERLEQRLTFIGK
jgi:hypothetical protein